MKILIAYDGTLNAKKALLYGINKVQKQGGSLTVLQVFDRAHFIDYDAGPSAEAMARREAANHLEEARRIAAERGVAAIRFITEEGQAEQVVREHIAAELPDLVLAPPRYRSLAKSSPRPLYILPGTILAPVDSSGVLPSSVDVISEEAAASGSQIVLVGIIPIHLYSKEETEELARITSVTAAALHALGKALADRGLRATEVMRSGYPDEEILKAADEYDASLVLLPSGGATPSELTKATAILLDEPDRLHWPFIVLPAETTA